MSPTPPPRTAVVDTGHRARTLTRDLAARPGHRVVTEKPRTVDAERCACVLDTVRARQLPHRRLQLPLEERHSGGLMVRKASHHFDLVYWWLADRPEEVFDHGRLAFYGPEAGARHGLRRLYERAHGAEAAAGDRFAAG